jgi:hypothetical protein
VAEVLAVCYYSGFWRPSELLDFSSEYNPMPARTELLWEGKYDAKGNRVLPLRVKLPFQELANGTA